MTKIVVAPSAIAEAVTAELLDYFSDARVTGIKLHEADASWIASGAVRRLLADPNAKS